MDISSNKEPLSKSNKLYLFLCTVSWFIVAFVLLFALYFSVLSLLHSLTFATQHLSSYPGQWMLCLAAPALLISLAELRVFKRRIDQTY
jgi:hypothetical protein